MRSLLILTLVASAARGSSVPIPEATSYAKPVAGGRYVLVQLGDAGAEQKYGKDAEKKAFRELREKYPTPGLYTSDTAQLVYPLPANEFAAYDHTFVSPDGVYLVRIDGDFWKTEQYTGGRMRPSPEQELAQIDGPAVSFWRDGTKLKQYSVRDLIKNPEALPATPDHILWYASGVMTTDAPRFSLNTQESIRHTFDYTTGTLLASTPVGMANPLVTLILIVMGVMTALILAVWVLYVYRTRRGPGSPLPDAVERRG